MKEKTCFSTVCSLVLFLLACVSLKKSGIGNYNFRHTTVYIQNNRMLMLEGVQELIGVPHFKTEKGEVQLLFFPVVWLIGIKHTCDPCLLTALL